MCLGYLLAAFVHQQDWETASGGTKHVVGSWGRERTIECTLQNPVLEGSESEIGLVCARSL